jgi:Ca2+-binding RTX toxin-like protein
LSALKTAMATEDFVELQTGFDLSQYFQSGKLQLEKFGLVALGPNQLDRYSVNYFLSPEQTNYALEANLYATGNKSARNRTFNVTGNSLDNTIIGTDQFNELRGLKGNDTLYGLGEKDTLYGEDGNDTLYGGEGDDELFGGIGNDTLYGENASEDVTDGFYDDELHGDEGNDTLYGGIGDDKLDGGDGDDRLIGFDSLGVNIGDETDTLTGGGGKDYFVLAAFDSKSQTKKVFYSGLVNGGAIIEDWQAEDKLDVSGIDPNQFSIVRLGVSGSSTLFNINIFYKSGGSLDLIAIIQNTTAVIKISDFV